MSWLNVEVNSIFMSIIQSNVECFVVLRPCPSKVFPFSRLIFKLASPSTAEITRIFHKNLWWNVQFESSSLLLTRRVAVSSGKDIMSSRKETNKPYLITEFTWWKCKTPKMENYIIIVIVILIVIVMIIIMGIRRTPNKIYHFLCYPGDSRLSGSHFQDRRPSTKVS